MDEFTILVSTPTAAVRQPIDEKVDSINAEAMLLFTFVAGVAGGVAGGLLVTGRK